MLCLIWAECLLSAIISFNPHNSVRSITVINLNLQIKGQDKERLCNSPTVMQQVSEAGLPNPCSLTLKPACSVTMLCSRPQEQEVLSAKGGGVRLMLSWRRCWEVLAFGLITMSCLLSGAWTSHPGHWLHVLSITHKEEPRLMTSLLCQYRSPPKHLLD